MSQKVSVALSYHRVPSYKVISLGGYSGSRSLRPSVLSFGRNVEGWNRKEPSQLAGNKTTALILQAHLCSCKRDHPKTLFSTHITLRSHLLSAFCVHRYDTCQPNCPSQFLCISLSLHTHKIPELLS